MYDFIKFTINYLRTYLHPKEIDKMLKKMQSPGKSQTGDQNSY